MTPNVCGIDRVLRVVLGLVLALALILGFIPAGTAMIAGIVVALIMLGTGLFGFCPAYRLLGLKSCRSA